MNSRPLPGFDPKVSRGQAFERGATIADRARSRHLPGLVLALLILVVYGGLAVSVDFPRAAIGLQSDEATYYMMGHSLAEDGDLTYRRGDLERVWREFPGGPSGVFLKKGRDVVDWGLMRRPPFFWTTTVTDPERDRAFFGKAFIYAVFAAPFVKLLGTNGFLVLHTLLLSLVAWCSYLFLEARMRGAVAAMLAGAFVMASVVPVYFVWITPELFLFALGVFAYFCWLYKEVATPAAVPRGGRWLLGGTSDIVAALLLGIATFSKVTNALLVPPIVAWQLWRRQWRQAIVTSAVFGVVTLALFAVNLRISGEWNYQGGEDRGTFYHEYPLQSARDAFAASKAAETNEVLTEIIFGPMFWTNLTHNIGYFFVGRYAGLVAYFFPAVFALAAFAIGFRRRPAWQYLVVAAGLAQMFVFLIWTPYTWLGGGGSVGNRYFMSAYGIFVFLMPVVARPLLAFVPWAIGALFMAPLVLNPFYTSFYPGSYAKRGPLRLLPVELTLVYDWPINTDRPRVVAWVGDHPGEKDPGFQLYFFDDNAYAVESDKTFWIKGGSRAEFLVKTDRPMRRLTMTVTAGAVASEVAITVDGRTQRLTLAAGQQQRVVFALDDGFLYQGIWPVWTASVSSSTGFVPIFHETDTSDVRYLGVRVDPRLIE